MERNSICSYMRTVGKQTILLFLFGNPGVKTSNFIIAVLRYSNAQSSSLEKMVWVGEDLKDHLIPPPPLALAIQGFFSEPGYPRLFCVYSAY